MYPWYQHVASYRTLSYVSTTQNQSLFEGKMSSSAFNLELPLDHVDDDEDENDWLTADGEDFAVVGVVCFFVLWSTIGHHYW